MAFTQEYLELVRQLGTRQDGVFIPLEQCALGLCGEAAEVDEALDAYVTQFDNTTAATRNVVLELGDVCFYLAALVLNLGLEDKLVPTGKPRFLPNLSGGCGRLAELVKKSTWHGKQILAEVWLTAIMGVLEAIDNDADFVGSNRDEVLRENITKLRARWPNGFGR